ncbi:hypothetical protein K1T71_003011 [Dendrolimus kikuchii]|uniref:Uncharacterized protein n=1 Tax=Dendrolimus kikuchii TaxID=765133 RepID=A0ACC1DAM2_9NEOP|nr:hypothetical protein K1T71_003011 [Dendrolimus kikuchii]
MPPKKESKQAIVTEDIDNISEASATATMSERITLSVLTKFIKPYKGDRESLPAFLTNCDNAISLASTDQQTVLCKYIISQLEGKAQLACCIKRFDNWSEIKQFLKSTFGEKKHSTHLLVDLQNCKQLPSEDVTQYSLRVESCLTRLQADIHYSCQDEKELLGRLASMEDLALNSFLLGMNTEFSHIVRCRNPKSLSEAISHAVEEEKLHNLSKLSRKLNKQCSICNKGGHLSSECYRNKKPKQTSYHINSNNHIPRKLNHNYNSNSYKSKTCAYCKKPGHLIQECRKLQFKNNNGHSEQGNFMPSSTSNFIKSNSANNVHVLSEENKDMQNGNLN